jgi:mono/diheme cytochrome c family protein
MICKCEKLRLPHRCRTSICRAIALLLWVLACASIAVPAQAGQREHASGEIKPDVIYHNYCSVCHGDRGDGRSRARNSLVPPPADFTSPQVRASLTRNRMIDAVTHGKPGTAMTAWSTQLNAKEVEAVVDFIMAKFMQPQAAAIGAPEGISGTNAHGGRTRDSAGADAMLAPVRTNMDLPFPQKLNGNASKGRVFYMANCATCHGAKGDGQGPRAYFINPKPRNFLDAQARSSFNRPALYAAVAYGKLGTEMPAWNKVLSPQEIANVAEFVHQAYILPGQNAAVRNR